MTVKNMVIQLEVEYLQRAAKSAVFLVRNWYGC